MSRQIKINGSEFWALVDGSKVKIGENVISFNFSVTGLRKLLGIQEKVEELLNDVQLELERAAGNKSEIRRLNKQLRQAYEVQHSDLKLEVEELKLAYAELKKEMGKNELPEK